MSRRRYVVLAGAICAVVLLAVFHNTILFNLGAVLVNSEAPEKADAALVLGGDYNGRRILKAAELYRQGYAPRVFVSGAGSFYGSHESVLAIDFAVRRGYPREAFVPLQHPAVSTLDELRGVGNALRAAGVHRLLLVTSPSHTGRATRLARSVLSGIDVHPVAADDPHWRNGYWWTDREGRKTWFLEMTKTLTGPLGV